MYLRFYGFQQEPFQITPDPALLFPSATHREALAALVYAVEQRKGFVAITGEVGLGKTTILRAFLAHVDTAAVHAVYVLNPAIDFDDLLDAMFEDLDLGERPATAAASVRRLFQALIERYGRNESVVLIIDDAQRMPPETLEGLRILSNLETATAKLLQIVLAGQTELDDMLRRPSLRQLNQRIAVRVGLRPLSHRESVAYIGHRLAKAAGGEQVAITPRARAMIARAGGGVPRVLNILCDNALLTGFGYGRRPVDRRIVREVLADQRRAPPRRLRPLRATAAAFAGLAVVGGIVAALQGAAPWRLAVPEAPAWLAERWDDGLWLGRPSAAGDRPAAAPTSGPTARDARPDGEPAADAAPDPASARDAAVAAPPRREPPAVAPAEATEDAPRPAGRRESFASAAPVMGRPVLPWPVDAVSGVETEGAGPSDSPTGAPETAGAALAHGPQADAGAAPAHGEAAWRVRTVRPGDNLWLMIAEVYGDATAAHLRAVGDANPDIEDFDTILPGQRIAFPPLSAPPAAASPETEAR